MEFRIEDAVNLLRRTPGQLRLLLSDLGESFVTSNEGANTFSPFDVVGHLIHGERTDWIPRARIILEQGADVTFRPFDRFAMYEESRGKSMSDLLDEFERLRGENLQQLQRLGLDEKDLGLRGTHPELGTVTLGQLLATWVVHDLGHIRQIVRTLAHQYRDEVGPWRPYLSILGPV